MVLISNLLLGLTGLSTTFAASAVSCSTLQVRNVGVPVGEFKNVSGISMYHSYPPRRKSFTKAIIYISDISGATHLNKLVADSYAANDYLVVIPDLFDGGAVPEEQLDANFNLDAFGALHPPQTIDRIINLTIAYLRNELAVKKVGGVGYYFGGRYVPRFLREGAGIDVGFVGHPYNLTAEEVTAVTRPLSIAAGTLDTAFNSTAKARAESILNSNSVTFQTSLYFGAPNGFGVRVNQSVPVQVFAKQASFVQAIMWFGAWL